MRTVEGPRKLKIGCSILAPQFTPTPLRDHFMTDLFPPDLSTPAQPSPPVAYGVPASGPAAGTPGLLCRFCGNGPAVQTVFRQHTGMIILMKFNAIEGPFCRDCGLYSFRATTGHTLLAGWWGIASAILGPLTLLVNVIRRPKVARLAPPVIGPEGRTPVDPGKPLWKRANIIGLAFPLLVIAFFIALPGGGAQDQVGRCVKVASNQVDIFFVSCSSSHDGIITQVVDRADQCPADGLGAVSRETTNGLSVDGGKVLCVGAD